MSVQRTDALRRQQPDQIVPARTDAKIQATVRVHFDIQVTRVSLRRAEEKLQAAVLTRLGQRIRFLRADRVLVRVQVYKQSVVSAD